MKYVINIIFLILALNVGATTYYVSNDGDDSNNGTTTSTTWEHCPYHADWSGNVTISAGDQILLKRGDTFYGALTISNSGSSGSPITFGAYGTGDNPIITGFTSITAWTDSGGNVWESTSAASTLSTCNMVVIDGINTPMGRFPNSEYYPYQTFSGYVSITSSSINSATTDWTGAEAVIKKRHWIINRYPITNHSGGTLTYSGGTYYTGMTNYGFFIQDDIRTLDVANEWYYNSTTNKISVYGTSEPTSVKIATVTDLITVSSKQYITFDGITFQGANEKMFNIPSSQHIKIENCEIEYTGIDAIYANGSTNVSIEGNIINHTNNNGVVMRYSADNGTVLNNIVKSTSTFPGMGQNDDGNGIGIFVNFSDSVLIQYNEVDSTGYSGIDFRGDSIYVRNNFVNYSCFIKDDGGGIYTFGRNQNDLTEREVVDNIVLNTVGTMAGVDTVESWEKEAGHGIYLDDESQYVTITGNTVVNSSYHGVFLHNSKNNTVNSNTFYGNTNQIGSAESMDDWVVDNEITDNICVAVQPEQVTFYFYTNVTWTTSALGDWDDNYYARPIDDDETFWVDASPTREYKTLYEWQTFVNDEANSEKSAKTVTSVDSMQIIYNTDIDSTYIEIEDVWEDIYENEYSDSIKIAPYESLVLYFNRSAPEPPEPPTPRELKLYMYKNPNTGKLQPIWTLSIK